MVVQKNTVQYRYRAAAKGFANGWSNLSSELKELTDWLKENKIAFLVTREQGTLIIRFRKERDLLMFMLVKAEKNFEVL